MFFPLLACFVLLLLSGLFPLANTQKTKGQFPGVFLFTTPARMIRPVTNLRTNSREYIGTFEQVYMDIAVCAEEFIPDVTTHLVCCAMRKRRRWRAK